MAKITNFQTDLLRTFVSVVDLGAYTKAGNVLGRTQPAISLQIKRLEELVGATLITQTRRTLQLTSEGEMLLSYAREILRLNDELASFFNRSTISGVLRVGLPNDYAFAFLQKGIVDYMLQHSDVSLEIHCDWSARILERLRADELDLAVAMTDKEATQYISRTWVERPVWAASENMRFDPEKSVPLAAHPEGCAYRARMIQSLDAAHIRWRIAYTGPGITGLQNAVANGLGVTALTRHTLRPGMRILSEKDGFPPMSEILVGLFYKHPRLSDAGIRLVNHLISKLDGSDLPNGQIHRSMKIVS